jgi:hypothetical protein
MTRLALVRRTVLASTGSVLRVIDRRLVFRNCIFMLAHMRCGSTALSHVLCANPDISGYGEAHVPYRTERDVAHLAVKCRYFRGWKKGAPFLFDKILWNHLDIEADESFMQARAVFMCRNPADTIASILNLATRDAYMSRFDLDRAASYYERRLTRLIDLWERFDDSRKIGFRYSEVVSDPDTVLSAISAALALGTPLANRYERTQPKGRVGTGDPLDADRLTGLVAKPSDGARFKPVVESLAPARRDRLEALYRDLSSRMAEHRHRQGLAALPCAATSA